MRMSIMESYSLLFVMMTLFPWLSFSLNDMDSQPWQYVLSLGYFILRIDGIIIPKNMRFYFVSIMLGILFGFLIHNLTFNITLLRGLGNHLGIFLLYVCIFDLTVRHGFPAKTILFANFVWLFAGLIEYIGILDFSNIVNSRTSMGRGVTALATEPTFFGMQLFFMSLVYFVHSNYNLTRMQLLAVILNIFAIAVLAKSSMVLLFLIIAFCMLVTYLAVKNLKLGLAYLGLIFITYISLTFFNFEGNVRVFQLVDLLRNDGVVALFQTDGSLNGRLQDIVVPWFYFMNNFGLPAGFNNYGNAEAELVKLIWNGYFWYQPGGNIIMSYIMSMIVEIGILGVFGYFALSGAHRDLGLKKFFEHTTIFILLLAAIPLANALPIYLFIALSIRSHFKENL